MRTRLTCGTMCHMDSVPSPRELRTAARSCTVLAYAAGLAGIAAGTLVLRDGSIALAVIVWVMTFGVGACLMGVAVLLRAMVGTTATIAHLESDVRLLVADRRADAEHPRPPEIDPHRTWSTTLGDQTSAPAQQRASRSDR